MLKNMKDSPVLYPQFSKMGIPMVVAAISEMGIKLRELGIKKD
jgi:hypothetical protein